MESQFDAALKKIYGAKRGRENRYEYLIIRVPQATIEALKLERNQIVHVIVRTFAGDKQPNQK